MQSGDLSTFYTIARAQATAQPEWLAIILAEGGLTTDWRQVRPSIRLGVSLATLGVAVSVAVGVAVSVAVGVSVSVAVGDTKLAAFAIAGSLNWIAHWYRAGRTLTTCTAEVSAVDQGDERIVAVVLATIMTVRDRADLAGPTRDRPMSPNRAARPTGSGIGRTVVRGLPGFDGRKPVPGATLEGLRRVTEGQRGAALCRHAGAAGVGGASTRFTYERQTQAPRLGGDPVDHSHGPPLPDRPHPWPDELPSVAVTEETRNARSLGCRTPHVWLDDGSSLFDAFHAEWTLLVLGPDAPDAGAFQAAAGQGVAHRNLRAQHLGREELLHSHACVRVGVPRAQRRDRTDDGDEQLPYEGARHFQRLRFAP